MLDQGLGRNFYNKPLKPASLAEARAIFAKANPLNVYRIYFTTGAGETGVKILDAGVLSRAPLSGKEMRLWADGTLNFLEKNGGKVDRIEFNKASPKAVKLSYLTKGLKYLSRAGVVATIATAYSSAYESLVGSKSTYSSDRWSGKTYSPGDERKVTASKKVRSTQQ